MYCRYRCDRLTGERVRCFAGLFQCVKAGEGRKIDRTLDLNILGAGATQGDYPGFLPFFLIIRPRYCFCLPHVQ